MIHTYINRHGYTVEAVRYDGKNLDEVINFCGDNLVFIPGKQEYCIVNKHGNIPLYNDDYIIKFFDGSFNPQLSETFNQMYKIVG